MRLIDADELLKHKGDCYDSDGHLLYAVGTGYIIAAPTVDAVRVVHGRWKEDTDPADGDLRCTRCGVAWPKFTQNQIAEQGIWTLQTLFKYCPRCGAKMDKEVTDAARI